MKIVMECLLISRGYLLQALIHGFNMHYYSIAIIIGRMIKRRCFWNGQMDWPCSSLMTIWKQMRKHLNEQELQKNLVGEYSGLETWKKKHEILRYTLLIRGTFKNRMSSSINHLVKDQLEKLSACEENSLNLVFFSLCFVALCLHKQPWSGDVSISIVSILDIFEFKNWLL